MSSAMRAWASRSFWVGWLAFIAILATPALAQPPGSVPPPPVRGAIDENGVDVTRGEFTISQTPVSIGPAYPHGLSYTMQNFNHGWQGSVRSAIFQDGITYTATVEGVSDSFTLSGGVYTPTEANGASLALVGSTYTYTGRNGLVATYTLNTGGVPFHDAPLARSTSITYPDGTRVNYTYKIVYFCLGGEESGSCPGGYRYALRLQSVTNNHGYQLKLSYATNTLADGNPATSYDEWIRVTSVRAINNAVEYCDPAADTCSFTNTWPNATFALAVGSGGGPELTVTDPAGLATRYTSDTAYRITGVRRPGASSDNITISYGTSGVSSLTINGVTYSYGYSITSGGGGVPPNPPPTLTTTVTDPNGNSRVYVTNTYAMRLMSYEDELDRVTEYEFDDTNGRLEAVEAPLGNRVEYSYDSRGNVTQVQRIPVPMSGESTITTSATYPGSCSNVLTCNQPTSTTDALGRVTDYTYDSTHGGTLTATLPAPAGSGTRPQTRYSYTAHQAYYKNSGGSIVASGTNVYLLTGTSACQTSASCTNGSDEAKTTIYWGPQTSGIANNLLPLSTTSGDGTGSLAATTAATYDNIGNTLAVDGPLSGTADTTTYRYDADRRRVGTISPDPDDGGSMLRRARRITYSGTTGLVTKVEQGTVTGTSDPDWANFSPLLAVDLTYDSNFRPQRRALSGGGSTQAVTDLSYDGLARPLCATIRMNSSAWATLTAACTAQTAGSHGPDRIRRIYYDAASQVTSVREAFGLADEAIVVTNTYTANGQLATVTDALNNKTTYSYDGHNRLEKTEFPSETQGSGTSDSDNYEQLTYDANGNVTNRRLRDGTSIAFSYDHLNRVTTKNLPGSELDVTYTYDLLNRMLTAQTSAQTLTFTFDALGRNLTQVSPAGTASYQYDLAGRRTRLTYPGSGLYIDYDYFVTNEVQKIRENGATSGVGVLATYAYDNLGRRTSLTRGNGTSATYSWDNASRLSQLVENVDGTSYDQTLGFSYNPASQITSTTRSNDTFAYTAHANGNRTDTYNGLNQMTAFGLLSVGHDARGNTTSVGTLVTSEYSSENLMTEAYVSPNTTTLSYDPLSRLFDLTEGSSTTRFGYDGNSIIAEHSTSNVVQRRFVRGASIDEILVWYEGGDTSDRKFLHADERGSIVAITNSSGVVSNVNRYDEYGIPATTNTGRFQYTGQLWLSFAQEYYYRARMYNPNLGRFMQADPIGYAAGMNLYSYVRNDAINSIDPSGLCWMQLRGTWVHPAGRPEEGWWEDLVWHFFGCEFPLGSEPGIGGNGSGNGQGGPEDEQICRIGRAIARRQGSDVSFSGQIAFFDMPGGRGGPGIITGETDRETSERYLGIINSGLTRMAGRYSVSGQFTLGSDGITAYIGGNNGWASRGGPINLPIVPLPGQAGADFYANTVVGEIGHYLGLSPYSRGDHTDPDLGQRRHQLPLSERNVDTIFSDCD